MMTVAAVRDSHVLLRLGLRENLGQFSLLVVVNAFVGAMVGMERSVLPLIAAEDFGLAARTAALSFIVVFGITKAVTNYVAGRFSDRLGRKQLLVAGWLLAVPVPFMLMWAPTWEWVLLANVLLGANQGLAWSTTVIMKIDLVGPQRRGLAMGLNEFAGYIAVAAAAYATGWIAAREGLRPEPFYLGVVFVAFGLGISLLLVRETVSHVRLESTLRNASPDTMTPRQIFWRTTVADRNLSSITQAGLVNNLNDGMAWGLFPLFFAAANISLEGIAALAAVYPATWGVVQLGTGALSDRVGRKWLIASGMWTQAIGIAEVIVSETFPGFVMGAVILGIGTAMVYPTLLAGIGDVALPSWRASAIGVYRFWRDLGYALGADHRRSSSGSDRARRRHVGGRGTHVCFWIIRRVSDERNLAHASGVRTMPCSCGSFGVAAEQHFTAEKVSKELQQYRRKGPGTTTRLLRDGLVRAGVTSGVLLDVGGGFGALTLDLLDRGMSRAVMVEASSAYLAAAADEAARRGRSAAIQFVHDDFLAVANQLPRSTVVTLDRVVCCYPFYEPLLEEALRHAERGFAFSYPRDKWYVRIGVWFENAIRRRRGNPFRTFVHPVAQMQHAIARAGFTLESRRTSLAWCADVFLKRS